MSTTTTGRVVGALFLLAFVVYLGGGALVDAGTGASDVLSGVADHQVLIAAGALLMLVNSAVVIGIGVLMFPILKPRHEITAHAYLVTRVVEAVMLAVGVLFLLLLIPLAEASADAGADAATALTSLAGVLQAGDQYALHVGMIALGIGGSLFSLALYRSGLVPGPLAVLGMIGYPVMAAGEALWILGYDLGGLHFAPGGVFEMALGVLLLVRGFPTHTSPPHTSPTSDAAGPSLDLAETR